MGIGGGYAPVDAVRVPTAERRADRREAAAALEGLIAGLRREIDGLGLFQRQWYKRTLKQRSGLGLEEWESLSRQIKADPAGSSRYAPDLKRLAAYFSALESDARGFIRDQEKLEVAIAAES